MSVFSSAHQFASAFNFNVCPRITQLKNVIPKYKSRRTKTGRAKCCRIVTRDNNFKFFISVLLFNYILFSQIRMLLLFKFGTRE